MSENQPKNYDVVLGSQNNAPIDGVILGGLEGVKRCLENPDINIKLGGLYRALNYGDAGLELIIQALYSREHKLKVIAHSLLKERQEERVIEILRSYNYYQTFDCIATLDKNKSNRKRLCISPDGKNIFIITSSGSIKIWNWQRKTFKRIKPNYIKNNSHLGINYIYLHPKAETIFVVFQGGEIGEVSLQHPHESDKIFQTKSNSYIHHSLTITPNGQYLLLGSSHGQIDTCNLSNQKLKFLLKAHSQPIFSLAISPDGQILASGSGDYTIKLWDWKRQTLLHTLQGHEFWISCLCISPDGKTLFSGSGDSTIKIWNCRSGKLIRTLQGNLYGVNALAISPDGKTLFSCSGDSTIKIWDWQNGELLNTLTGHTGEVYSIAIAPDGKHLFSASQDNTIKVWG
jgi:COMPASS component SWD3